MALRQFGLNWLHHGLQPCSIAGLSWHLSSYPVVIGAETYLILLATVASNLSLQCVHPSPSMLENGMKHFSI